MKSGVKLLLFNKKIAFIFLLLIAIFLLQSAVYKKSAGEALDEYYGMALQNFDKECNNFSALVQNHENAKLMQLAFTKLRLAFKKFAFIPEFYNPYQVKFLNAPALRWVQDDDPTVLQPYGLQVIEELIYSTDIKIDYSLIAQNISVMLQNINTLQAEKNRPEKFTPTLVFIALKQSVIRLQSMGITGFDSPIALQSLPEAMATLDAIETTISFYKNDDAETFNLAIDIIDSAKQYISTQTSFEKFDRLYFISHFINPLYQQLVTCTLRNNWIDNNDRSPINPLATSMFDKATFNINAYSPTEKYRPTAERIALGKKLFYDTILSYSNRSCATCHKPELAFTDGKNVPTALDGETAILRNTPTLLYAALQTKQFYDSRISVLENQINDVVHNQHEMGGNLANAKKLLSHNNAYAQLFDSAYPTDYDKISVYNISNALASYVRSLIVFNSRFDKNIKGISNDFTIAEKNGFNLFMGKAKCGTCHYAPLFNGLVPPSFSESESEVIGVPLSGAGNKKILDTDLGKGGFTKISIHNNAFKTPTVRNISKTAPYMHNAAFSTLAEVLSFYNNGGGAALKISVPNQTLPGTKLGLTRKEMKDIIAFMQTLTDEY